MASSNLKHKTQRRGDETRLKLIAATKKLLAEYDYSSLTLERISETVGVAKSSILWHFGSKEGLLTEAVFDLFEEVDQKINLEKAVLKTLPERLGFLFKTVAEYFKSNPWAKGISISLMFNNQVPPEIHERLRIQWVAHVEEIQNFLSSESEPVSGAYARGIMALLHGCYLQWCVEGCKDDPAVRMQQALSIINLDADLVPGE